MIAVKQERDSNLYKVYFEERTQNKLHKTTIEFKCDWEFSRYGETEFGTDVGRVYYGDVVNIEEVTDFLNESLYVMNLRMPHPVGRNMFISCLSFFTKETDAPITYKEVSYPGYPILQVVFDNTIIDHYVILGLVQGITESIQSAVITTETLDTESDEGEEDEVVEGNYVEYDFEDELREALGGAESNKVDFSPLFKEDEE